MATGYFNRVFDTVVSGNALLSSLSGDDVRALEFEAAVSNVPPLDLAAALASNTISVDELIQAALPSGLVVTSLDTGAYNINLGSDTSLNAARYVSLFNLRSTNDVRVLRFVNGGVTSTYAALSNTLSITNATGGTSKVQVELVGAGAAATAAVFTTAVASGSPGFIRDVFVSATSLTSGAEVVIFNVGAYGNTV